jgi:1-acyl-sn-glycerol-3-phosphate acyltransferase
MALGRLRVGHCIGIFPEGERTWDGRLRAFKYSTVRFLLSAQVPVVVVRILGGYQILPRWSKKIMKGKMCITVERSFSLLPGKWQIEDLKQMLESFFISEQDE